MRKLPFALIGLLLIILAFFLYREAQQNAVLPHTYTNTTYSVVFSYPDGYVLSERGLQDVDHGHYAITLLRSGETIPAEGEGPTGITVDIYPRNDLALEAWIRGVPASNFSLGNGVLTPTTVDGVPAFSYHWSGLYEGETTAFLNQDYVVLVSVTRLSPDEHTKAYQDVLSSMRVQ